MHIFGKLVHIFGKLGHIFGKLVHIFGKKLVSRTSKQFLKNLGPLWQPGVYNLAHRNRSDFCDLRLRCPSRTPEIARFPRQDKAMLHCDLKVRWKVASDLRFRAAISEPKTPSFCGISGDLAQSTRKSLAIAIVRFWCAKVYNDAINSPTSAPDLSAPSPGDDLRLKLAIRLRGQTVRSDSFWERGCDFSAVTIRVAVAMRFAMKDGKIRFSLRNFLAISSAIQKLASDCGCDAVVHLALDWGFWWSFSWSKLLWCSKLLSVGCICCEMQSAPPKLPAGLLLFQQMIR